MLRFSGKVVPLFCILLGLVVQSTASHVFAGQNGSSDEIKKLFFHGREYGSDAAFNPISSFINYAFDTLQMPLSFDTENLDERRKEVWTNLTNPDEAINEDLGWGTFIHRQVVPTRFDNLGDSRDMIPNYVHHLIGGGMVYRKNVEWFETYGYRHPRFYSAALGIIAEFAQEVVEKKSTRPDDEVADFYIFRPLGMLLFSSDKVARFFSETMGMVEWSHQPMYDMVSGRVRNIGENFVMRPSLFSNEKMKGFVYYGGVTLLGLSHKLNDSDYISWGAGQAVQVAEPLKLRTSAGLFYDRDGSLMCSLIVNGTDEMAARLNVYPGLGLVQGLDRSVGFFAGLEDGGSFMVGITISQLPIGLFGVAQ